MCFFLSDDQINNTIANENNKNMKKETEKMKEWVIFINSGIIWKLKKLKSLCPSPMQVFWFNS